MKKNFSILLFSLSLIFFTASILLLTRINKKPANQSELVAMINNEKITDKLLDSVAASKLYRVRREALQNYIAGRIMELEAKDNSMPVNDYVAKEIFYKLQNVTDQEINDFLKGKKTDTLARKKAFEMLLYNKRKIRQKEITDSLSKSKYKVSLNLKTPYTKADLSELQTHNNGTVNSNLHVYIITEFDCGACRSKFEDIDKIYNKFKSSVKFSFVTYSVNVTKGQVACEAAALQGKYKEMYDQIFRYKGDLETIDLNAMAKKIGLNVIQFNQDMNNTEVIERIKRNNEIIGNTNSLSTPQFIIDDYVVPAEFTMNETEQKIIEFLQL